MTPSRADVAAFYLYANYRNSGPRVVLLTEARWTQFLKSRVGIPEAPFYTRPRRVGEPEVHANGHPWAWIYSPEDALKDEARWLSKEELLKFEQSMQQALAVAKEAQLADPDGSELVDATVGERNA